VLKPDLKPEKIQEMNFDYNIYYILENNIALLRPLKRDDLEHLLPFSLNEPELWTYSLKSAAGEEAMRQYIDNSIIMRKNEKEYTFIVFDKRTGSYAGSTRFYDIQPVSDTVQIGFTWYGKDFQGSGLNKHCKYLLLQFAFENMKVYRVEFRADFRNKRSIAAMKKIGCTEEGVLRSNTYCADGSRRNSIVLSILKEEWYSQVKQNLFNILLSDA